MIDRFTAIDCCRCHCTGGVPADPDLICPKGSGRIDPNIHKGVRRSDGHIVLDHNRPISGFFRLV